MSVGEEPIEINFDDYKNEDVVIIKGENIDVGPLASNGAGKSLIQEAISFGLFGKTIREIEKIDDCINNLTTKGLVIEIDVNDLKIKRMRKPNKLELEENGKDITLSSMVLTQTDIENKLGMNHHTFANTCCFGQHNNYSFLSANKADKRKIVEDILQLCEYNRYEENSRRYARGTKNIISNLSSQYERSQKDISNRKTQLNEYIIKLKQFKTNIKTEIENIKSKIKEIEKIDIQTEVFLWEEYESSLEDYNNITKNINQLSEKENGIRKLFLDKENELQNEISPIKGEIQIIQKDIVKINNLQEGVRCNSCYQIVDKENYSELRKELETKLERLKCSIDKPYQKYLEIKTLETDNVLEIEAEKEKLNKKKHKLVSIKKPLCSKESLTRKQAEKSHLEKLLLDKESQVDKNPYAEIITDLNKSLSEAQVILGENEKEISKNEELLPYYNFWIKGFGDTGVKSFVIEQIIPILNQQINYWLQFLIDNKIIVKFDKFLNVEIERPNDLGYFTYNQGSGGEKKRIDLAITLAFAYITKLRSNSNNNFIFLDELAESIDVVEGIRRTLAELSKSCTVFLITHRPDLLNDLENKKKITIRKDGGFSKILTAQ